MFAIKKMRERAGMTQQQVADALGIKKPRYGDWERETREINLRDAIKLAELFDCTLDELADHPVIAADTTLTPEERGLLDDYRATDARGRAAIVRTAEGEAGVEAQRPPWPDSGAVSA